MIVLLRYCVHVFMCLQACVAGGCHMVIGGCVWQYMNLRVLMRRERGSGDVSRQQTGGKPL